MCPFSKTLTPALPIAVLVILPRPALADDTKGKITTIKNEHELVLTDSSNKDHAVHLVKGCKIFIDDEHSEYVDLNVGDQATVRWDKKDGKVMASEIRVKRK